MSRARDRKRREGAFPNEALASRRERALNWLISTTLRAYLWPMTRHFFKSKPAVSVFYDEIMERPPKPKEKYELLSDLEAWARREPL